MAKTLLEKAKAARSRKTRRGKGALSADELELLMAVVRHEVLPTDACIALGCGTSGSTGRMMLLLWRAVRHGQIRVEVMETTDE